MHQSGSRNWVSTRIRPYQLPREYSKTWGGFGSADDGLKPIATEYSQREYQNGNNDRDPKNHYGEIFALNVRYAIRWPFAIAGEGIESY